MKRFVVGDIHGRFEALKEVLTKSNFDLANDLLIVLGDIVDGGYFTYEVVEQLLQVKNIVYIIGNHDEWWMDHLKSGWAEAIWITQGGANTIRSYGGRVEIPDYVTDDVKIDLSDLRIPQTHKDFFNKGVYYYVMDNMVFVHGGFNPRVPLQKHEKHTLLWDRNLLLTAQKKPIYRNDTLDITKNNVWDKVFVGHTTTQQFSGSTDPLKFNNLWMVDTGAGWTGKLTIMDVDTEEYWQSEIQEPARGHDV